MSDLSAAVDAAARVVFARVQDQHSDDGSPVEWDNLAPLDQLAYREFVLPLVVAALAAAGSEEP